MDRINVIKSSMPTFEEYTKEIESLFDSHWLTNNGEKHSKLEVELKKYLNTENITLFTNGHLALENIITAMNLTGEVITTPFTFISTSHAIVRCGLKPIYCDINNEDYTIDVSKIEKLITEKTSAIIPVHVYGNICDYKAIEKIAKKYDLKVIYDAAHAFGVTVDGVSSANLGDASMFSFHATKVFNTIEGGAVVYKDKKLSILLNHLKNFGITGPEDIVYVGGNAKMNEFQAAMGLCNLKHLDEEILKRKKVAQKYQETLSNISGIKVWKSPNNVNPNYAYFPIVFENYKYTRDDIYEKLKQRNIYARKYFYPICNDTECYGHNYESTPIAYDISTKVLTLPIYSDLDLFDVDRICNIILN